MHYFRFHGGKWYPNNLEGIMQCNQDCFKDDGIAGKVLAAYLANIIAVINEVKL